MKQTARDQLIAIYFDWVNNYLTAECFAEHNGLTADQAVALIDLAREVTNSDHPDA